MYYSDVVKMGCEKTLPQGTQNMNSSRDLCCILVKSYNSMGVTSLPCNTHGDEGKLGSLLNADVMSFGPGWDLLGPLQLLLLVRSSPAAEGRVKIQTLGFSKCSYSLNPSIVLIPNSDCTLRHLGSFGSISIQPESKVVVTEALFF